MTGERATEKVKGKEGRDHTSDGREVKGTMVSADVPSTCLGVGEGRSVILPRLDQNVEKRRPLAARPLPWSWGVGCGKGGGESQTVGASKFANTITTSLKPDPIPTLHRRRRSVPPAPAGMPCVAR